MAFPTSSKQTEIFSLKTLANLPVDWLNLCHQATKEGDLEVMRLLIYELANHNQFVANALNALVNHFDSCSY